MKRLIEMTDNIEDKINIFFNWLNKEPDSPTEALKLTLTALAMFVGFFTIVGLVTNFVGV